MAEHDAPASAAPETPTPVAPLRAQRRHALVAAGIALLLLAALVAWVGPQRVADALRALRWAPLLAALGVSVAATLLGAFNAWQLGALRGSVTFPKFIAVFWCGWAVGLVVPGQVGDVLLLTGLLRRLGVSATVALGRLGVDKLLSLMVVLGAVVALPAATGEPRLRPLAIVAVAVIATLLVALAVGANLARRWRGAPAFAGRWRAALLGAIEQAGAVFRRDPGRVLLNLVLSVVKLALIGTMYWLAFRALGVESLELWRVTVVAACAGLVAYVPISLNGMGTVEVAGVLLFGTLGIAAPVVTSAYLLLRATTLLAAWLPIGLAAPIALRRQG